MSMVPAAAAVGVVWVALLMAAPWVLPSCTDVGSSRWSSPSSSPRGVNGSRPPHSGSAELTQASDTVDRVSSATTSSPLLMGLNPVQAEAVTHADGPLLIIA